MKKIISILVFCQLLTSCFLLPLAPHSHYSKCLNESSNKIKLSISCFPKLKVYNVTGTEITDTVYISSTKKIINNNQCETRYVFGDTMKSYSLRIGDSNFHTNLLNDTIKITIKMKDSKIENYYFLTTKDSKIKD
ncbi:MAG: hypothetical protein ACOYBS_06960 [Flavobacterium sp.]